MIIGPPTDEMRGLFDHAVAAQRVAFGALRPGVTCAAVDGAVGRYFEENGLLPFWRQHTGHAIGLRNHEAPFLEHRRPTLPIEPGMVFTIEPGLYSAAIGGLPSLRHGCRDRRRHRRPHRLSAGLRSRSASASFIVASWPPPTL